MGRLTLHQIELELQEENNIIMSANIFLMSIEQISKLTPKDLKRRIEEFLICEYIIEKLYIMITILEQKPYESYELCVILRDIINKYENEHV